MTGSLRRSDEPTGEHVPVEWESRFDCDGGCVEGLPNPECPVHGLHVHVPWPPMKQMIEGVHAAAGELENVLYTKWYQIDGDERYIYRIEKDGRWTLLGRMWKDGDGDDKCSVEMPFDLESDEHGAVVQFETQFDAENYVSDVAAGLSA
jgi:hypothetical protein